MQRKTNIIVIVTLAVGAAILVVGVRSFPRIRQAPGPEPVEVASAEGAPQPPTGLGRGPSPAAHEERMAPPEQRERAQAAVSEALGTEPARLSTTGALPPFDQDAFLRHPREYLAKVEPARCFQTARPGPDTVVLQTQVANRAVVNRGEALPLWVKTAPNAPVTFTAFDGGQFTENGLGSVSVQADAKGLAAAHFTAPRGIDGDVYIIAGSPLAAGVQRFHLRVSDPASPR
jgi:hypothetical protein